MKRKVKAVVVLTLVLVTLPFLVVGLFWLVLVLNGSGSWPFKSLEKIENEIALSNGGIVHIEAIEQRGFRSDGWTVYARYQPADSDTLEEIGVWEGYNHSPDVYVSGALVVLPSPDQTTLFVRQSQGRWKFFSLRFPIETTPLPMSHYTTLTTLSKAELSRIRSDLDPDEAGWSPSVSIQAFHPESREILLKYQTNLSTIRHLGLQLSEDGSDLSLLEVRKEKIVP